MPEATAVKMETTTDVDQITINTIRMLAVDMVEAAGCGHPGAPMGQAALAYQLWTRHLRFDPTAAEWPDRDRFVLSCGHASALIYAMLHLAGYDLPMAELKSFRQLGSKTPGHPEHGLTPGVETTTGPLGQGLGNGVGMAIAERLLGSHFNRDGFEVFGHRVWVFVSDGDMMEGVASEVSSLAGHLGLGKLNVFYDDNRITIDGSTDLAFSENVVQRYQAYGWHTLEVDDGNDLEALEGAMAAATAETGRPTLVRVRTHIGFGSPNKQDTSSVHGEALGADETALTKRKLGWPLEPAFHVPGEAREAFAPARRRGGEARAAWEELFARYREAHPELAAEFDARLAGDHPGGWQELIPGFTPEDGPVATRRVSGAVLNALAPRLTVLAGGSADLAPSNNTMLAGEAVFSAAEGGRNFHFGVREHGMGAVMNGMALSKMLRPYGGTFLIFSDYMRPAIRLAALMELPTIYVFTHDSILLGEDGPTHQPVSQLLSMRSIPGLLVLRPADANETAAAWRLAIEHRDGPTALILTRQKLPIFAETVDRAGNGVARGGYVIADPSSAEPRAILLASGSEVSLAVEAHRRLLDRGIATRVVSLPCWSLFDAQDAGYRESVLPASVPRRLAIEAGVSIGWHKYAGAEGEVMSQDGFGASAPGGDLARHFGFTAEEVVRRVEAMV
ncbi:MAG: transketolase [Thermoanaerobaculia bacterium]